MKRLALALVLFASLSYASPTTITDVLHQPYNSLPAAGVDVTITQTAFFNSSNQYFPSWSITIHPVTDANGNLSIQLEPNPAGQPYSVVLTYPNGVITREFWSVPVSASPLTIKQVLTTVGPTPPLGIVQLGQLAQGGAVTGNFLEWLGSTWGANTAPLGVGQGGTGAATLPAHGVLIGAGANPVNVASPGSAGQVLTSNGPNADSTFQPASGGGTSVSIDLYANAPACAASAFLFFASDAALEKICNGSSSSIWKYKGVTVTPTITSDLSSTYNFGGASVTTYPGSWLFTATTGASDNWRGKYRLVPSTPYSVVTCMEGLGPEHTFGSFGMFWTDGTKIIAFAYSNQLASAPPVLVLNQYSNATTYAGTYMQGGSGVTGGGLFCMAMIDDGTNRKEKYSFDKKNWIPIHSVGNTDFLTATGVGVVVDDAATAPVATSVQIVSVETLNSAL